MKEEGKTLFSNEKLNLNFLNEIHLSEKKYWCVELIFLQIE